MENENLEFDVKPAGNKDLWLFLIILDIILLCVFGFFLYKHFSTKIFNPSAIASVEEQTEVVEPLAIEDEAVLVTESAPIAVESVAATPKEEKLTEVVAAVTEQTEQVSATDKKESVLVKVNPKSKFLSRFLKVF